MSNASAPARHFKVAISYAREDRNTVEPLASLLGQRLGQDAVLYDQWHTDLLTRARLEGVLCNFYEFQSDVVVVFLSGYYPTKEWCKKEIAAITRRAEKQPKTVLYFQISVGDYESLGVNYFDGKLNLEHLPQRTLFATIIGRLEELTGTEDAQTPHFSIAHLSDLHFRFDDDRATDRHDPRMLRALSAMIQDHVDCVAVSGDLTSRAGSNSFERSRDWLARTTQLDGKYTGLELEKRNIPFVVVPGNSDYHDELSDGRLPSSGRPHHGPDCWPILPRGLRGCSLDRFRGVYPHPQCGHFSRMIWFETPGRRGNFVVVYRVLTPPHGAPTGSPSHAMPTPEYVVHEELKDIARCHNLMLRDGHQGISPTPWVNAFASISREQYARAAKIVVMHAPFDDTTAFGKSCVRRLASFGVHAILCGHGHRRSSNSIISEYPISVASRLSRDAAAHNFPDGHWPQLWYRGKHILKSLGRLIYSAMTRPCDDDYDLSTGLYRQLLDMARAGFTDAEIDTVADALVTQFRHNLATESTPPTKQMLTAVQNDLDRLTREQFDRLQKLASHELVRKFESRLRDWKITIFRCGSSAKAVGPRSASDPTKHARMAGILRVWFNPQQLVVRYDTNLWDEASCSFQPDVELSQNIPLDR